MKIFKKLQIYVALLRPFTLGPPAIGMISGSFVAWKTVEIHDWSTFWLILLGATAASMLNGGSNSLNQIYDLEIDRINKPLRPLPSKQATIKEAYGVALFCYTTSLAISAWLSWGCFLMFAGATFCTLIYSMPPLRTKRFWWSANLTIAVPRGLLLKVAGWSVLSDIAQIEPWYIGLVFCGFLLGATTTKDYADMLGDQAQNCSTLPIRFGIERSIQIISPCFILPFALLPIGSYFNILHGNPIILWILGITLMFWGWHVVRILKHDPHSLALTENHPSWTEMYRMMMYAQIGVAVAYLVG